jgi:hypothetical protein
VTCIVSTGSREGSRVVGRTGEGRGGELTGGSASGVVGGGGGARRGKALGFIGEASPVTLR